MDILHWLYGHLGGVVVVCLAAAGDDTIPRQTLGPGGADASVARAVDAGAPDARPPVVPPSPATCGTPAG
jgi:hypothetical protein